MLEAVELVFSRRTQYQKNAMDHKLLLIKSVTLLYRESQIPDAADNSATFLRPLVETITLPELSTGVLDTERDVLAGLKHTCLEMCDQDPSHKYVAMELLQKIRHATRGDENLYNAFRDGIDTVLDEKDLKLYCVNVRQELRRESNNDKAKDIVTKAAYKLKFKTDEISDVAAFIATLTSDLEPYHNIVKESDPAVVGEIDFGKQDEVASVLSQTRELNDDKGIMRTGWQGLNRMLQGGFRRGETWVVGALQHNFKTGFSLSVFQHIAMYNTPYMLDPKKKPMMVRISFEDPLALNLPFLYRNIYENKTGEVADFKNKDDDEIAEYVIENLTSNGYEIRLLHVNPSMWTFRDLQNKILSLEAEGYEIHVLGVDYLAMLPTTGCNEAGPTGSAIRDLFRRMRNFCAQRKITMITPHQLATDAKQLIRNGMDEKFLSEIANKGYYDGCRTIDQEVDGELYIHKVIADGKSFLMVQRGKHRVVVQTPQEYLSCTLAFEDIGNIRDDINGPDNTRRRPGGGPIGSKDEKPYWSFEQ